MRIISHAHVCANLIASHRYTIRTQIRIDTGVGQPTTVRVGAQQATGYISRTGIGGPLIPLEPPKSLPVLIPSVLWVSTCKGVNCSRR